MTNTNTTQGDRSRPTDITINRERHRMHITWQDGHRSVYELKWLRLNCPCAECDEQRRQEQDASSFLPLRPAPSFEITNAQLVGQYAIQFTWADGHTHGIYSFEWLRAHCPCPECTAQRDQEDASD